MNLPVKKFEVKAIDLNDFALIDEISGMNAFLDGFL